MDGTDQYRLVETCTDTNFHVYISAMVIEFNMKKNMDKTKSGILLKYLLHTLVLTWSVLWNH